MGEHANFYPIILHKTVQQSILYQSFWDYLLKLELSPSKKFFVIFLISKPFKDDEKAIYFILKALLVLKIFKFFSQLFGRVGKTA